MRYITLLLLLPLFACESPMSSDELDELLENDEENTMLERYDPPNKYLPFTIPPRRGPWSGSNNIGNEVGFDPDANNRQRILKLPEWGPPVVWTLSLGIDFPTTSAEWIDANGNLIPDPVQFFTVTGEVLYGAGGTTQLVKMDWRNGSTITLPMNAMSVDAVYNFLGETVTVPVGLRLRAILARGSVVGSSTPTLTQSHVAGIGAFSPIQVIPNFASRLFVMQKTPATPGGFYLSTINVQFFGGPSPGSINVMTVFLDDYLNGGMASTGIPIPAGARFVALRNNTGALISSKFIFELSL